MNPTASAPRATASSASSSLVIPQILTNMTVVTLPVCPGQQGGRFRCRDAARGGPRRRARPAPRPKRQAWVVVAVVVAVGAAGVLIVTGSAVMVTRLTVAPVAEAGSPASDELARHTTSEPAIPATTSSRASVTVGGVGAKAPRSALNFTAGSALKLHWRVPPVGKPAAGAAVTTAWRW